ncbi:MAG TPA: valine--tRNA ligase [Candidatus Saccharimonadales bacterium]|nr:valine--tRNA ligase [Candidatus Saccharimonadales bacterium]
MNLPKTYEPSQYEADIYALWEKSRAFEPQGKGDSYSIVVPPPNANGDLHIGHALTLGIEDIAVRYHRLRGHRALLLPGADHAGFETQVVYEKRLAKEGKSRFDFSREELYQQIWDFVAQNRQNFENQLRRLGAGVDWSRYTFTLDPKIVKRAYATFKKMWDEGLIYRGERLVNYCTFHRTGFADIEVTYEDAETPLYYIKYGPFTLATTRPETKFGDTAVAVHPDDKRYKKYVGTVIEVQGVNGPFSVQVVADEMVDPSFGTGVVKITPAHSFDDWEVAQRHNLPAKRIINHDGTLNHHTGRFEGMTIKEGREAVAKAMKEQGILEKVDEHYKTRIGKCYKCGTVIEPMLMEQWFVDMQPLAKPAIEKLRAKKVTFYPDSKREQLITYLENLRDWNISRQIAWGIPIPAFQNVDDSDDWIYDERVDQEIIEKDGKTYHRDPDVFDTWFSSSSWPYATLDYPDSQDFKEFYPLALMETGGEILYPWVSRMLMLGLYVTGEIPFKGVYIHGYVLAEDGAKMSKSLGNVINPLEVVDKYGSDAMRMGIIAGRVPAVNRGYDHRKVEDARNFCNKLWNIARYIEDTVGEKPDIAEAQPETAADHWMLHKMQQLQTTLVDDLDNYRLAEAYDKLYHFVWDDLADWYIEASKAEPNKALLARILADTLVMLHPFAPFVTETIWQTLSWTGEGILATETWPKILKTDAKKAATFADIQAIVSETRFIVKALGVSDVTLYYTDVPFLTEHAMLIKRLARVSNVTEVRDGTGLFLTGTSYRCWLDIDQATASKFLAQLETKQVAQKEVIARIEQRLSNASYVKNAPKQVVEQSKQQLEDAKAQLQAITREYERFRPAL